MPYEAITHGVRIRVEPAYAPDRSEPERPLHVWVYSVEIANLGPEPVRLVSRYWRIVDAHGRVEEVSGPGVVGEQPVIVPGGVYAYASGCPLTTTSGMMQGHYVMELRSGATFQAVVPAFSLDLPGAHRVVN